MRHENEFILFVFICVGVGITGGLFLGSLGLLLRELF
jgi:hypothetical protein